MKFAFPEDGAIVEWIEEGLKEEGPFDAEPISLSSLAICSRSPGRRRAHERPHISARRSQHLCRIGF
jgi:hypothetical protein